MNATWMAALPALALTLVLSSDGQAPQMFSAQPATPHLGEALAEQRNLAAARPADAGVWNDLGNLLALSGNLDEAESAYERSLELDPGSVQALFNLGLLRQQRGDLVGAASDYAGLLQLEPGHAWGQYQLGTVYEAVGDRELALAHYAEAFTLDPELLFAEKNPHVIENKLVTEALLRARRRSRAAPPAPRAYDEPARINSILTPSAAPAVANGGTAPEALEEEARDAPATAAAPRDQISRGAATRARSKEPGTEIATSPQDRVLDTKDLRGSVQNQVRGSADDGGAAPQSPSSRRRSAATVMPQQSRGRSVNQPPADGDAFGIGQRSTGSLEWKLGPASDEPVPAR